MVRPPVDAVQNLHDRLNAARMRVVLRHRGRQFLFEHFFDLVDHIRRRAVHQRDALGDVGLFFLRQRRQDGGCLLRLQIGQDQRDRLRIFVLDEVQDLRGIRFPRKVKRTHLQRRRQAIQHLDSPLGPERPFQHFLGVGDTALGNVFLRQANFVKLFENRFALFTVHGSDIGDFQGQLLDFVVTQMFEHLRGYIRSERNQEDGRFLPTGQRLRRRLHLCHVQSPLFFRQPRSEQVDEFLRFASRQPFQLLAHLMLVVHLVDIQFGVLRRLQRLHLLFA